MEFHHRIPRGMGGTAGDRAAVLSSPSNCLMLCGYCHRWVESHRDEAFAAGHLVPLSGDPAEVAAVIYELGPRLLDAAGGYVRPGVGVGRRPTPRGLIPVNW